MRETDAEPHPVAVARQRSALLKAASGWGLVLGGLAYAFVFEQPVGFIACGVGGGILSIDNALKVLGR